MKRKELKLLNLELQELIKQETEIRENIAAYNEAMYYQLRFKRNIPEIIMYEYHKEQNKLEEIRKKKNNIISKMKGGE